MVDLAKISRGRTRCTDGGIFVNTCWNGFTSSDNEFDFPKITASSAGKVFSILYWQFFHALDESSHVSGGHGRQAAKHRIAGSEIHRSESVPASSLHTHAHHVFCACLSSSWPLQYKCHHNISRLRRGVVPGLQSFNVPTVSFSLSIAFCINFSFQLLNLQPVFCS